MLEIKIYSTRLGFRACEVSMYDPTQMPLCLCIKLCDGKLERKSNLPDIERTSPTSSVVKFKPPISKGLTAHNEKTCGK